MDEVQIRAVRLERTLADLAAVQAAIAGWLARRRDDDTDGNGVYAGRHKTQLEALTSVLSVAAEALQSGARGLAQQNADPPPEIGAFYDSCRDFDEAAIWLQRLWGFFKAKLDQRDDDAYKGLLKAADEVVWSCYHAVMARARQRRSQTAHGPAPLPFIAPEYSPAAIESDRPLPIGLTLSVDPPGWDPEVDNVVKALPMGFLQLPPWCITAPWWLLYGAHEVGHHVQADLSLHEHVQSAIETAVARRNAALAPRWKAWSKEIFADFFSALMVGPWAAWSVMEVERSAPARMVRPKSNYPPPVVRVALLAAIANALDPPGSSVLSGFDVDTFKRQYPVVAPHLDLVDDVVAALREDLPGGLGTLESLCGFNADRFQKAVGFWKARLGESELPATAPTIETARYVVTASVARYADIVRQTDPVARATQLGGLAEMTIKALHASAEPGTRGDVLPAGDRPELGAALARRLTALSAEHRNQPDEGG
jgi:hypothetical protein